MKTNERTLKMKEAFAKRYKNGETVIVREIAKEFDVSETTVYGYLDDIVKDLNAEGLKVKRDDLLQRVFFADHSVRNYAPVKPVDRSGFEASYQAAIKEVKRMSEEIAKNIADNETYVEILEEE